MARVEVDPAAVADALAGLDAGALAVDPERYLVEVADRRPSVLTGDGVATPARPRAQPGEVVLRGSFGRPGRHPAARAGSTSSATGSRSDRALAVRPRRVAGGRVGRRDHRPGARAAGGEVPALQAALDGRRLPERRLLAEGVTPPLPSVSYLPAMILAALATMLATGWLVGYPLFRRAAVPDRISSWPMVAGDEVLADLYGAIRAAAGAWTDRIADRSRGREPEDS